MCMYLTSVLMRMYLTSVLMGMYLVKRSPSTSSEKMCGVSHEAVCIAHLFAIFQLCVTVLRVSLNASPPTRAILTVHTIARYVTQRVTAGTAAMKQCVVRDCACRLSSAVYQVNVSLLPISVTRKTIVRMDQMNTQQIQTAVSQTNRCT